MKKTIKKYVVCFKNKATNELKYFVREGNPSYDVINKIKYKKKTYELTTEIDLAMVFPKMSLAETCVYSVTKYREDLLDTYDIYPTEYLIGIDKVTPMELARTLKSVIDQADCVKNEEYHKDSEIDYLVKLMTKDNTLVMLGKIVKILTKMKD